ncbi:MAG: DUF2490 domain-containing protein [Congregibacter sp.]
MLNHLKQATARALAVAFLLCELTLPGIVTPVQATENAPGNWLIGVMSGPVGNADTSPWLFAVDAQLRHFDIGSGIHEYLLRPAVGVAVNNSTRVWLGYGRFRNRNGTGRTSDENRYWQQVDWSTSDFIQGRLTLRARTEQRDISFSSDRREVLRLMARYEKPLPGFYNSAVFASIEPFFDLNHTDWGGDTGLSQNRLQLGLGFTVNPQVRLEAGFMHQYFPIEIGPNRANYLGMLTARWRF